MFKLVVLSALVACTVAAPSKHHDHLAYAGPVGYAATAPVVLHQEYHQIPAVAKVGEIVEHVPSSVSHHSSAVVHSSAAVATPIITKAEIPIVEEVHEAQFFDAIPAAPLLKEVHATAHDVVEIQPEIHAVPALAKVAEVVEHVPTSVSHHSSSVVHSSAAIATPVITPVAKTVIAAAPVYKAPLLKQVHTAAHDIIEVRPQYYHAPAVAKVAEVVEHVPTSVSHHSSAVVHSSAAIATPVITPVAKTVVAAAPVYQAPVYQAPVLKQVYAHDVVEVLPENHHAPAFAKVAEVVEHVPTSVSHHSSAVVHDSAAIATPVITPVTKTVVATAPVYKEAPVFRAVHAPATYAVHQAPLYHSAPYAAYHHGPAYYHNEPLVRTW